MYPIGNGEKEDVTYLCKSLLYAMQGSVSFFVLLLHLASTTYIKYIAS